jgi:hypothetical protein
MSETTRVIRPVPFAAAQLVSTNAVNPDAAWSAGTYAVGARVTHSVYDSDLQQILPHQFESLINANSGTPGVDADKWIDLGLANTVAMFGRTNASRRTTRAGSLQVVLQPAGYTTALGLFGLQGGSVTVEVLELVGGVYQPMQAETRSLSARSVTTMLEYLFEPRVSVKGMVFEGLPGFPGSGNRVRITVEGETAGIGAICYGPTVELGYSPNYGASSEITDFLGVERNDFGDLVGLIRRAPYASTKSFTIQVDKAKVKRLEATVEALLQTPTVWIGNGNDAAYASLLVVYGVYDSAVIVVPGPSHSVMDLRVIGVASN